jgi:hypothetical protein
VQTIVFERIGYVLSGLSKDLFTEVSFFVSLRTLSYLSLCNLTKWKESGGIIYKREPGLKKEGLSRPKVKDPDLG